MNTKSIMEASGLYKCIADPQRLRILNLLEAGALCVCHMQELLEVPQVKMSKQLAAMKQLIARIAGASDDCPVSVCEKIGCS